VGEYDAADLLLTPTARREIPLSPGRSAFLPTSTHPTASGGGAPTAWLQQSPAGAVLRHNPSQTNPFTEATVRMPLTERRAPLSVLVVDDEELLARSCTQILAGEGYLVSSESRGRAALNVVRRRHPEIVLMELHLPDLDGLSMLNEIRQASPETLVIMITDFATVTSSAEAIQAGAYDYLSKPFTATQLRILVGRAARRVELVRDNALLRDRLKRQSSFDSIVGTSPGIQKVFTMVSRVSPTEANVFISGESGTGKELVARAIHGASRRSGGAFVAINCAALPDHLLESELFGHEKGAFTGANTLRRGLLETAAGGTFFLDEISEMSLELQAKMLRVVQERRIRRVGGDVEIPIDVRWLSATNRDPDEAVRRGALRQDLYFRLNVVPVKIPPLRQRAEDIPLLAQHFLKYYGEEYGRTDLRLDGGVMRAFLEYDWPGNVRELQNVIERIVSLSGTGSLITTEELPEEIQPGAGRAGDRDAVHIADLPFHAAKAQVISDFEVRYLRELLVRNRGNISRAAREAGMDRKTIHRMLSKYEIDAPL
jgi:DNA-binding NtrC family response regulator